MEWHTDHCYSGQPTAPLLWCLNTVTTNAETGILMSRSPTATEDIRSAFNESPSNPLSDQQNSRHASHGSNSNISYNPKYWFDNKITVAGTKSATTKCTYETKLDNVIKNLGKMWYLRLTCRPNSATTWFPVRQMDIRNHQNGFENSNSNWQELPF